MISGSCNTCGCSDAVKAALYVIVLSPISATPHTSYPMKRSIAKSIERGFEPKGRAGLVLATSLALFALNSCYSMQTVTLTAANTRAPVLLGKLDRIGSNPSLADSKQAAEGAAEEEDFYLTLSKTYQLSLGAQPDTERASSSGYTDVVLATFLQGDDDMNVFVECVEVKYTGAYYVFGFLEKQRIKMLGRKSKKGQAL